MKRVQEKSNVPFCSPRWCSGPSSRSHSSGLPAVIGESIRQDGIETVDGITLVRRPVVVDLFEPSTVPQHAVEAHELKEPAMSLSKIGAALGISKRLADWASRMGAAMAARGLTDPFVRLTERPEKVSRWNRERGRRDDGNDQRRASWAGFGHRECARSRPWRPPRPRPRAPMSAVLSAAFAVEFQQAAHQCVGRRNAVSDALHCPISLRSVAICSPNSSAVMRSSVT